jgi:hypothetical protein
MDPMRCSSGCSGDRQLLTDDGLAQVEVLPVAVADVIGWLGFTSRGVTVLPVT